MFAVAATTPLTTISSATFVLAVIEVAVTVPVLVEAPVENPDVKVPLNLPKFAATGLASVKAAAVEPEAMLEKAAATSLAVMLTLAVNVRPLTVTNSFGLSALNAMRFDSVVPLTVVSPCATLIVMNPAPALADKSVTLELAVTDVNLTTAPLAVPVEKVPFKVPALTTKSLFALTVPGAVTVPLAALLANAAAKLAAETPPVPAVICTPAKVKV